MADTALLEADPSEFQEVEPHPVIPPIAPGQPGHTQWAAQNNNPGNIQYVGPSHGQVGAEPGAGGFARFNTPEEGYADIHRLITEHSQKGHTLSQYIGIYAPPNQNNTAAYIANAAKELGVKPETPLMYVDPERLAAFQAKQESSSKVTYAAKPLEANAADFEEAPADSSKTGGTSRPLARTRALESLVNLGRPSSLDKPTTRHSRN